jgi:uncharacterized protein involved in exopolysaccharide biosynthesis/Mrp family chromosome partitioning ATPase
MTAPIDHLTEERSFTAKEFGLPRRSLVRPLPSYAIGPGKDDRSLQALLTIFWRQRMIIGVSVLFSMVTALGYLLLATPHFTATARMVIDTKRARVFQPNPAPDGMIDSSVVASQVEIAKSEVIAEMVIQRLGLLKDPEFTSPRLATSEAIVEWIRYIARLAGATNSNPLLAMFDKIFGPGLRQNGEVHDLTIAVSNLERSLQVNQIGRSYVAEVSFSSVDPGKAAKIANAVANAYIDNQLDARIYNTDRADAWIRRRLLDLHEKYKSASDRLAKIKASAPAVGGEPGAIDIGERIAELEATVNSYKNVYDTSVNLSRYVQSVQEQAFPITEARIISEATPPLQKSTPKLGLTVLASLMVGGVVGCALALAIGLKDRRVWTRSHVEHELGLQCLGFMRRIRNAKRPVSDAGKQLQKIGVLPVLDDCGAADRGGELLRAVRAGVEARLPGERCRVLGVTSASGGDGKSTVAANLAAILVECGRRVLLISGAPWLSRAPLAPEAQALVVFSDVAGNKVRLADAVTPGPFGSLLMIDRHAHGAKHSADIWCSPGVGKLMTNAAKHYDYVVIDFPSLLTNADAEAAADYVDMFVLVAKHASTTLDELKRALESAPNVASRVLGAIVNVYGS